jgi:hypothetical protein
MDFGLCDRIEIEFGIDLHAICRADVVPFGRSVWGDGTDRGLQAARRTTD